MKKIKENSLANLVMLLLGIVFFFLLGNRGYVILRDSVVYTEGYYGTTVMPFYISFVQIIKYIFSNTFYLYIVVFLQGIFAIVSSFILANYMFKTFDLKQWQRVMVYLLSFLPYAYSLPEEVATHEIMTEAISFSIFYLFFIFYFDSLIKMKYSKMIVSMFVSFILIGIRIQMVILIPIVFIGFIILIIKKRKISYKKVVGTIFIMLFLISVIFSFFRVNYQRRQLSFLDGTQVADALLGRAIYISNETDVNIYADKDLKDAFKLLYQFADKEKMRYAYADEYDGLKWHHIINGVNYTTRSSWENLVKFCEDRGWNYTISEELQTDIMIPIIFKHFGTLLGNFWELSGASMMAAILLQKESIYLLCIVSTIFFYILGIILSFLDRKKSKTVAFYLTTMLILTINVIFLNLLFYGLQRYVVYTYGLYYIALFLLIKDLWMKRKHGGY